MNQALRPIRLQSATYSAVKLHIRGLFADHTFLIAGPARSCSICARSDDRSYHRDLLGILGVFAGKFNWATEWRVKAHVSKLIFKALNRRRSCKPRKHEALTIIDLPMMPPNFVIFQMENSAVKKFSYCAQRAAKNTTLTLLQAWVCHCLMNIHSNAVQKIIKRMFCVTRC